MSSIDLARKQKTVQQREPSLSWEYENGVMVLIHSLRTRGFRLFNALYERTALLYYINDDALNIMRAACFWVLHYIVFQYYVLRLFPMFLLIIND